MYPPCGRRSSIRSPAVRDLPFGRDDGDYRGTFHWTARSLDAELVARRLVNRLPLFDLQCRRGALLSPCSIRQKVVARSRGTCRFRPRSSQSRVLPGPPGNCHPPPSLIEQMQVSKRRSGRDPREVLAPRSRRPLNRLSVGSPAAPRVRKLAPCTRWQERTSTRRGNGFTGDIRRRRAPWNGQRGEEGSLFFLLWLLALSRQEMASMHVLI